MRISDWSSDVCSSDLFLLCVVDLLLRPRHVHAENLRRVEQALGVVFKAEDRGAFGRLIGTHALEAADAVMQRVGQHMRGAFTPGLELAVVPDKAVALSK